MAEKQQPKAVSETKVVTSEVRFSYAHVWEPVAMENGGTPKYSVSLIIPKSEKPLIEKIKKAVEVAKENGVTSKWGGKLPVNLKLPLRDGDAERPDNPEYANSYFLNASANQRPGIVDAKVQPILDQSEFYSGCYGKASINFYPFNSAGSKGVACGLNHVQKLRDGEPLSGRGRAEDDFEAVDVSSDDLI